MGRGISPIREEGNEFSATPPHLPLGVAGVMGVCSAAVYGSKKSAMSACSNTFEYCRGCYVHVDCAQMGTHTHTHTHTHKHTHTHEHTHTHTYTQEQQGWVKAASEVQQVGTVTLQDLHTLQVTDATQSRAYPGGMSDIASFFLC